MAEKNALPIIRKLLKKIVALPNTIQSDAPNAAADDTPNVNGLTKKLRVTDCIIMPEIERPAPASSARQSRGKRKKMIILSMAAVSAAIV